MNEKRKFERFPIELNLFVSSLFKQDNIQINNVNSPIRVTDISKSGIGFVSEARFPLHYYFNATINFGGPDSTIYCIVEIVRCNTDKENPNINHYGCQFVGLSPVFNYIFDEYENKCHDDI